MNESINNIWRVKQVWARIFAWELLDGSTYIEECSARRWKLRNDGGYYTFVGPPDERL